MNDICHTCVRQDAANMLVSVWDFSTTAEYTDHNARRGTHRAQLVRLIGSEAVEESLFTEIVLPRTFPVLQGRSRAYRAPKRFLFPRPGPTNTDPTTIEMQLLARRGLNGFEEHAAQCPSNLGDIELEAHGRVQRSMLALLSRKRHA